MLQTIGTFEEIAMPQNGIYHVGITALSEAFSKNKNLQILNLNDNTLGSKGSRALAKAIRNLQGLRSLNLGDCLLKTKGAEHIADAIGRTHLQLEDVNFESNEIRTSGGVAIAKAVGNKPNLAKVLLDANQFGEEGREEIRKVLTDAGHADALGSFEDDESDASDEEEDDEVEDEEEVEEEEEEEDEVKKTKDDSIHDVEKPIARIESCTVSEFLEKPTGDRLLALGANRVNTLLMEAKVIN